MQSHWTPLGLAWVKWVGQLPCRRFISHLVGRLAYYILKKRRQVVLTNLQLAMPALPAAQKKRIAQRHFVEFSRVLFDNLWGLSASESDIKKYVRLQGQLPDSGVLLSPHFLGMELTLLRLSLEYRPKRVGFHYRQLNNPFWDKVVNQLRCRFGAIGFNRLAKKHTLQMVRHLQGGEITTFSPDIAPNKRAKDTVYVPFMAQDKVATSASVLRLKKLTQTPIVPLIICLEADGYVVHLLPPLAEKDCTSLPTIATKINQIIGEWAQQQPENYYWLHRRFK